MDNEIGDHDVIAACTYDDLGHPVPTDVSGFSLRWSVEASPGTREVGVRFNPENPPTETSGPEAIAHAEIDAVAAGDNEIAATLLNPNGYVVDSWFVEKHICCHEAPPEVPTVITAHRASRSIYGVVRSQEDYCISGRPVELFRRRKGYPAESIGSDVSGSAGRWRVKTGRRPGIYYARVYTEIPIEGGADFYCLEDQSRDVRRR
jgi:hypothetical protein